MVLKFHLKVHFNLALQHNQQRQRDPLKAKASGLSRESKCRRTFFLVLGRQTHSGDPGAREGCWPGAGEDSDQSTSSLSQNGLKPKSLSTPLLLWLRREGQHKDPLWALGKKGRMQARSWVLTNPDSRLKSHLAHTQNGWFNPKEGAGVSECAPGLFLNRRLLTGELTALLGQRSMPLRVQNWIKHCFIPVWDKHKTLTTGSHGYLHMTLILSV